jgi:hypothetical protein
MDYGWDLGYEKSLEIVCGQKMPLAEKLGRTQTARGYPVWHVEG